MDIPGQFCVEINNPTYSKSFRFGNSTRSDGAWLKLSASSAGEQTASKPAKNQLFFIYLFLLNDCYVKKYRHALRYETAIPEQSVELSFPAIGSQRFTVKARSRRHHKSTAAQAPFTMEVVSSLQQSSSCMRADYCYLDASTPASDELITQTPPCRLASRFCVTRT